MKIRNGFVSNSSSSSFLVMWDKKPESQDELKNILFGEKIAISEMYSDRVVSTDELAKTLFRDLTEATNDTIRQENHHYCSYWFNKYEWSSLGYKTKEEERELMNNVESLMKSINNKSRFDKFSELQNLEINHEQTKISIERKRKYVEISNYDIIYTQEEKKYLDIFDFYEKVEKVEKEIDKIYDLLTEKSIKKIKEDFKNSFISIYEYGDNIYETGGLFDNIFHMKKNRH